ncbi:MAG: butyrate kinase [Synergistota bacterium]|nr:butyrate kinase [Synergistota bacterium]
MEPQVLAINPGSTSTKIAWYKGDQELWRETVRHDPEKISSFPGVADQYEYRLETIEKNGSTQGSSLDELSAVVGRGGLLDPIPGGTYAVDDLLLKHLRRGKPWEHASNLGGILASVIAGPRDIPAFIVDPVAVDELDDVARLTGLPEFPKRSLGHALNIKAAVRRAATDLGKAWDEINAVVVHLGGGISVCAHRKGRMIDLNNANEFGPFSPERAGGVPAGDLLRLCYGGDYEMKELRKRLVGNGGLMAYLGTSDMREVGERILAGDVKAKEAYSAMAFQIAREIGAYAASLSGEVDAVLVTGGIAHDSHFVALIQERVQWIAPVLIYPGEDEMQALAEGALRVLDKSEEAKKYGDYIQEEAP